MKRWILVRAGLETVPVIQRPQGRGTIGAAPVWVDTKESAGAPDYYAKLVRKGLLVVLDEADENPRLARPAPVEKEPEKPAEKKTARRGGSEE